MIGFLKTLQRLKQAEKSSPGTRQNRWQKLGLVWRNRKKIRQIINAYLYLPFFLFMPSSLYFWPPPFTGRAEPEFVNVEGAQESIPVYVALLRAGTTNRVVVPARQSPNNNI